MKKNHSNQYSNQHNNQHYSQQYGKQPSTSASADQQNKYHRQTSQKSPYVLKSSQSLDESKLSNHLKQQQQRHLMHLPEHVQASGVYQKPMRTFDLVSSTSQGFTYATTEKQQQRFEGRIEEERMSCVSSPDSCSLPAFSDSDVSQTTAFTTPLPFNRHEQPGGYQQQQQQNQQNQQYMFYPANPHHQQQSNGGGSNQQSPDTSVPQPL